MSWAIKVENLYKQYRIGAHQGVTETLYSKINHSVRRLLKQESRKEVVKDENLARSENHIISEQQTEGLSPGHFWALKNVSFQIDQGDRVGIIGQNGSGKSTLLKVLSRITAPTRGQFSYQGRLISLLEVGTGFHNELSGRDNIYLNASINGMSQQAIRAKFNEILEFSELGEHIYTPVKRYSSGMYMRLAFSVAAHLESEILVVDEVLAVGDSGFQQKCKDKMLEVAGHGRTILFVSHDMDAIRNVCNKAIELSHGEIVNHNKCIRAVSSIEATSETELSDVNLATAAYTNHDIDLRCITTWPDDEHAPNIQHAIRLLSVSLHNPQGELTKRVDLTVPISVEIKYRILQPHYAIILQAFITRVTGEKVLITMDSQSQRRPDAPREVGYYTQRLTLPAPLLNAGYYRVEPRICLYHDPKQFINAPNAVMFQVVDEKTPGSVLEHWTGDTYNFMVAPQCEWDIEHTQEYKRIA